MVKLQEVSEQYVEKVTVEDIEDISSGDEDFEEDEEELDDETLWERIAALQDIIPAGQRRAVSNAFSSICSFGASTYNFVGKTAWILSTTAFVVALPLLFELERNDEATRASIPGSEGSAKELSSDSQTSAL